MTQQICNTIAEKRHESPHAMCLSHLSALHAERHMIMTIEGAQSRELTIRTKSRSKTTILPRTAERRLFRHAPSENSQGHVFPAVAVPVHSMALREQPHAHNDLATSDSQAAPM